MFEIIYVKLLIIHIISVMIAVGTVTVTDYLHILGLRDPQLERRTLFVFPYLSNLIRIALVFIYASGISLAIAKPEVLESPLFWTKAALVILVTFNGFFLHHYIFPKIEKGINKKSYPPKLIKIAAFAGSLSVVSWYSIVVLAMTKQFAYQPTTFLTYYVLLVMIAYLVAINMELRRKTK